MLDIASGGAEGNPKWNQELPVATTEWELVNRAICEALWDGNYTSARPLKGVSSIMVVQKVALPQDVTKNEAYAKATSGVHGQRIASCVIGEAKRPVM